MSTISVAALIARIITSSAAFGFLGHTGGTAWGVVGALVGLVLGVVHGTCIVRVAAYPETGRGWLLLVIDHTWSLVNTCVGSIFLAAGLLMGNELQYELSRGRTSVVLSRGVFSRFATTIGTVEAGTDGTIARHEYVHIFQARLFGPLYLVLVGANYVLATIVPYWLLYHDRVDHKIESVGDYFMKGVYPHVWNEEWAYRVEGSPP